MLGIILSKPTISKDYSPFLNTLFRTLALHYLIIFDIMLSYFPQVQGQEWAISLKKIVDFSLKPIRQLLPDELPFDVAPLIMIVILNLLMALW